MLEREHFNTLAENYESLYGFHKPAAIQKVNRLCSEYASWLNGAVSGDVLEIGAGTGFYTRHLSPLLMKRKYIAIDISEKMIRLAMNTSNEGNRVFGAIADCFSLPFEDEKFACITGHGILHHLALEKSIAEFSRVLKPRGRIAFYEPNIINPYVFLIKTIPFLLPAGDTPNEKAINPFTMLSLLRRYSFTPIQVYPCEFTVNSAPMFLIPLFQKTSRFIEKIPGLRWLGGSLRITAEKK